VPSPPDADRHRPAGDGGYPDNPDDPDRTAYLGLGGLAGVYAGQDTQLVARPDIYGGAQAPHPRPDAVVGDYDEDDYGLSNLDADDEPAGRHRGRPAGASGKSKAVWTLIDQIISSGTNTLLGVFVARSVSSVEFGAFSVAFTLFALFIGLSRAGATSVLGIRYAAVAPRLFRSAAAAATGTGFAVGIVTGLRRRPGRRRDRRRRRRLARRDRDSSSRAAAAGRLAVCVLRRGPAGCGRGERRAVGGSPARGDLHPRQPGRLLVVGDVTRLGRCCGCRRARRRRPGRFLAGAGTLS
jgi:hypothetical protein